MVLKEGTALPHPLRLVVVPNGPKATRAEAAKVAAEIDFASNASRLGRLGFEG